MDIRKQLEFAHRGEVTKRFHTVRTIGQNTVGEHSFSVVWLIYLLTGGTASAKLLMAGATHDLAEHVAGDMPSPSKRALGIGAELNELEEKMLEDHGLLFPISKKEQRTLKLADMFSGMLFCVSERSLGNKNIEEIYARFHSYVLELCPVEREAEVLSIIGAKWEDVL
jgi:5'-deoxynucleotidase YfbR-like HD superfamily hydrolase